MSRVDQYIISVSVAGNRLPDPFDKLTGGEVSSDSTKYWPGGMAPQIDLGGHRSTSDVVVTRLFKHGRDTAIQQQLINYVGRAVAKVTKLPLDKDGNAFGAKPIVYQGILRSVKFPDADSESTNAGLLEITIGVTGDPIAS